MGLFSSKKKVSVSSSIFNLAGDTVADFMQQTVFNATYREEDPQVGKAIPKAIIGSAGFKLRRLLYWLQHNTKGLRYQEIIGHYYSEFNSDIEQSALANTFIGSTTIPPHTNIIVDHIEVDKAEYYFWGAKYLAENYPQYLNETLYDFKVNFKYRERRLNPVTNRSEYYIIKQVTIHILDVTNDLNEIDTIVFTADDYERDKTYLYVEYRIYDLVPHTEPGTNIVTYEEPATIPATPVHYLIYANDTAPGDPEYNIGYSSVFRTPNTAVEKSTFILPPILFRLDNWQLTDADPANEEEWEWYELSKHAYKKVIGYPSASNPSTYDKVSANITENENIDKIDYVYMVFGTSINTKNWAGKAYIFNYMYALYTQYAADGSTSVRVTSRDGRSRFEYIISWKELSYGTFGSNNTTIPSWAKDSFSGSEKYSVINQDASYTTQEDDGMGLNNYITVQHSATATYFIHRKHKNSTQYEYVKAIDLEHKNYVAEGKYTHISAKDAFKYEENEETHEPIYEESAFIFPIHEGLYRQLPAVTQAQLSQSFSYLLFNCVEVRYVKWYQRGIFKVIVTVIVIIIAVVVTVLSWGSGTAAMGPMAAAIFGSLTAAGIGATMAMVVAALVQTLAYMLVGTIVAKLTTKGMLALGFNNFIANITGVVAGIVATAGMSGAINATSTTTEATTQVFDEAGNLVSSTSSLTTTTITPLAGALDSIYTLFTDPKLLTGFIKKVSEAGITGYQQDLAQDLKQKTSEIESLQRQIKAIDQQMNEFNTAFSEWSKKLTQWKLQTSFKPEDFFNLTLMTGTEIAETTLNYIGTSLEPNIQVD